MAALMQMVPEGPSAPSPDDGSEAGGFERWRRRTCGSEAAGLRAVTITIPMGNINTSQFRDLAQIMRKFCRRPGPDEPEPEPGAALRPRSRAEAAVQGTARHRPGRRRTPRCVADVVACPGADSCKLAITASNQAGYSMREQMIAFDYKDPQVLAVSVKISGCPNGCGQHHLAGIGLQGSSYKVGKLEVPCYDISVGGGGYKGAGRYAQRVARVLAKKAHLAIDRIFEVYRPSAPDRRDIRRVHRPRGQKHFGQPLEEFKRVGSRGGPRCTWTGARRTCSRSSAARASARPARCRSSGHRCPVPQV